MLTKAAGRVLESDPGLTDKDNPNVDNKTGKLRSPILQKQVREITFRKQLETTLTIPVKVNGKYTKAVVDTGSEITVISHSFAKHLRIKPRRALEVKLKGAGIEHDMKAYRLDAVRVTIGEGEYSWTVYEAPIKEDCIIGLDFLKYQKAKINLENNTVSISDSVVPAVLRQEKNELPYQVSRLLCAKRTVIPPNTAKFMECRLENPIEGEYICETDEKFSLLVDEATLHKNTSFRPVLQFRNYTDKYLTVKKDQVLGGAFEIDEVMTNSGDHNSPNTTEDHLQTTPTVRKLSKESEELPQHLKDLYERTVVEMSEDQKEQVKALLIDFQDIFAKNDTDLGCFTAIKHKIETGNEEPVKHKLRRTPLGFEAEEKDYLQKMLDAGVIRPSVSEWASSPVLIRKKDKTVRYCLDYRDLNAKTKNVGCNWPLPSIDDCLDTLSGSQYYSTIDLAAGYWQILMDEKDVSKTAWISKFGQFESLRMPFGLKGAPSTMQRAIEYTLRGLLWIIAIAYLDDVIIQGKSFENHLENLRKVFTRFRENNLKLKPKKCCFFKSEVTFLGRKVSEKGISVDPSKIDTVLHWREPKTKKEIEKFLGFLNYHREFIPNFSARAKSLFELKGKKVFLWEEKHQKAFQDLKQALVNPPVLGYPTHDEEFILDTDASDSSIAAVLYQGTSDMQRVISYGSFALTAEQKKYCTTRKELLAVVRFTRQYKHYLLGRKFTIRTDNASLVWLMKFRHLSGQLARWVEELGQYDFDIVHRAGKLHINADALSRLPGEKILCSEYKSNIDLEHLPCGGCTYCRRVQNKWKEFEEDVDYVVPLSVRRIAAEDENELDSVLWVKQYSLVNLRHLQKQDCDIYPVWQWMKENRDPEEDEFMLTSNTTKQLWACKDLLVFQNDILYYKWLISGEESCLLFVTPEKLQPLVLEFCHDNILAGHFGIEKTKEKVKRACFWINLNKDCENYVKTCAVCNLNKKQRKNRAPMKLFHAGAPMEKIHIDILGPLKCTTQNNKYILVMIDQFTKWIELSALSEQTSELTAKALVDQFISRFGTPHLIVSDQGSNFNSKLFMEVCQLLQIAKKRTSPYRPSANGQVERCNRSILQLLRCFSNDEQNHWDENLQLVASAMRATVNRQTEYTPNKMMLGREVIQPLDIILGTSKGQPQQVEEYVTNLEKSLSRCHALAREKLKETQKIQKKHYDSKLKTSYYSPGDLVYEINSATKVGNSKKLDKIWKGPLLVTEVLSPILYVVRGKKNERVVHHDRLKFCEDRVVPLWVRKLRNRFFAEENLEDDLEDDEKDNVDLDQFFSLFEQSNLDRSCTGNDDNKEQIVEAQATTTTTAKGRTVRLPRHLKDYNVE